MRTIDTITAEIVELSGINSAYNHFLASFTAQAEVECATLVLQNKKTISQNLKRLYKELANSQRASAYAQHLRTSSQDPEKLRMEFRPYTTTQQEDRAILHFNSDSRYSIRE